MALLARIALALSLALAAIPAGRHGLRAESHQTAKEYQVKAVFLYNFVQFVQWPPEAFPDPKSPLVVGILGPDPFKAYLDEVVKGEKVDGHPIVVARYGRVEDVKDCHLLFVGGADSDRIAAILPSLKSRRILTVGESELFARNGGMVSFVTRQGRIRLKINLDAVQAARLGVSSKLLRLAEIVTPGEG
jgi:hypothetical protein